ncbi:MAG TPA: IPT/TIG domain-containing protein [Solirubrobacterales bacterium]|nr:IPT/TIG domain-containing protein [Solirubrobacterales bacterium]
MAIVAMGATTAQAAPVTVGSPLTGPFIQGEASGGSGTFINLSLGEPGARVTSPVTGAVIGWSVIKAAGPFRLRVLRPAGGTAYTAVGSSSVAVATGPGGVETFSTAVPIQAGDAIGLDISKGNKIGIADEDPADVAAAWFPPIADGATASFAGAENEIEVGFNAVVQPAPTLTGIAPTSGSIKGGTAVTITGTDFAGVSGVSFGGVAAAFTVGSEGQITATAPPAKRGKVDVTVTTVAGTTAAAKFAYTGCVVPQLKGKKLKAAKKKLRKASCTLGKVKLRGDATTKTGRVVKQSRKAGKLLAPGTKVNVTLG